MERTANCAIASLLAPARADFSMVGYRFVTASRSASMSSVLMISTSRMGSTDPATWMMFGSSKHRTTCAMACDSRMCARNWFPSPSPLDAPFTSPAMSTKVAVAGTRTFWLKHSPIRSSRAAGMRTIPTFGSMVVNGKFDACALTEVMALKSVDFPTFGSPTMPHANPTGYRPSSSTLSR